MKTIIKACLLWIVFGVCAVQAADLKVGVVDIERVLRESAPAMNAEKKIKKEFYGREQDIKKLMKQSEELQGMLEKYGDTLPEADRRNKERELTALNLNLQRKQREFIKDSNLRKDEELAVVLEQANKAIQAIAESEEYDLILQEAVYRSSRIDITDKVIKHLAADRANAGKDSK